MSKNKRSKKNIVPLVVFLPLLAVILSSYAVFKGILNYTETSSYFNIREIKTEGMTDARYCEVMKEALLGTNIFRIDTHKLSQRIRMKFPTFYSVTVTRVLPHRLTIVGKERLPVAVVQEGGTFYLFDTEGVIVSSFSATQTVDFPVISGFSDNISPLKVGKTYNSRVLKEVLSLAKALRLQRFNIDAAYPAGNKMKITRIDASKPSELSFYLDDSLQVKIGRNDFTGKVSFLPAIIKSLSDEISNVKYIDLRPKEPVVATKKDISKK